MRRRGNGREDGCERPSSPAAAMPSNKKKAKGSTDDGQGVSDKGQKQTLSAHITISTITSGDNKNYPTVGDSVTVHYVGSLAAAMQPGSRDLDASQIFDSSRAKGQPFVFTLGNNSVIKGWEIGIPKLSLGQRATLSIGAAMAYGSTGCVDASASGSSKVPPNSDLRFDVELLDINGRRSLAKFIAMLSDWIHSKLGKYDSGGEAKAAADAKYGGRDAYEEHIKQLAFDKYETERARKGPRAPSIEEGILTAA